MAKNTLAAQIRLRQTDFLMAASIAKDKNTVMLLLVRPWSLYRGRISDIRQ